MTSNGDKTCRYCGVEVEGLSRVCVRCYRERMRPCPHCTYLTATGHRAVRLRGQHHLERDCDVCNNERWIMLD